MKTQEELNALKEEFKAVNQKLSELSEDELKQVTGGAKGTLTDISVLFKDCISTKTAPELPAETLGGSGYSGMY